MSEPQLARCPVCSAKVRLRQDGTLRYHLENKVRCDGSQESPVDLSLGPDDLMSVASLLKIGIYEALARLVTPEEMIDALQPTVREIRRIAAATQDELDAAKAAALKAQHDRESHRKWLEREYMRVEARLRKGIVGIDAARISEDGFEPHGFFVYFLWGHDDERPLYVGKSTNVLTRLGSHMGEEFKRSRVEKVTLLRCETASQMDETEMRMIVHHQPPWNTIGVNGTVKDFEL